MGFKAILHLCQVAVGKQVPTLLVAGNGTAWQWPTMHSTSTLRWLLLALRLTVATTYVQIMRFFKQIYILVSFEAIPCVKLISCK